MLVDASSQLRNRLIQQLQRAADGAAASAAHPDLATGVHEVRKAARRVRAIAELVREAVSRRDRRGVRDAIADARHVLGPARDHAVVAHILPHLVLDEPVREAGKLVLNAAAIDAPSSEATREALGESAATVVSQAQALERALPETLAFETLVEGVQWVYGRARRARKSAKRSKRMFHTWRRRTKELMYQLDVLGDLAGPRLTELRSALDEIAHAQRDAVDLLMLRSFARAHRDLVDRDASKLLTDALDAQLRPLLADVRRAGKAAFRQSPRKLARSACRHAT